jgi:hypothetical protein
LAERARVSLLAQQIRYVARLILLWALAIFIISFTKIISGGAMANFAMRMLSFSLTHVLSA